MIFVLWVLCFLTATACVILMLGVQVFGMDRMREMYQEFRRDMRRRYGIKDEEDE